MTPRQRAKAAGQKFYRTEKPCPSGHWSKRRTSTAKCVACEEARREPRRALQQDWYKRNATAHNTKTRDRHRALRTDVLRGYGGRCDCCIEDRLEFLCLDHIEGGGSKHRRHESNVVLFNRLRRQGYPKGKYRVLCHNCNFSLGAYGYCPPR